MHVVIAGAGRVGCAVARWVFSAGNEVAVIDSDPSRCAAIEAQLGSVAVEGDATEVGTLSRAGTNRADILVATTRSDETNLVACQLARSMFRVSNTVSLVRSNDHGRLFNLLGIDSTINTTDLVVGRVQEQLSIYGLVHLMPVRGADGGFLVSVKIPPDAGIAGTRLGDMRLPNGTLISLVISRDGKASIPGESTMIQAEDEVVAVTTSLEEDELRELLTGESGA